MFFLSQGFGNIRDMKVNTNLVYLLRFKDIRNEKSFINTLIGGSRNKSAFIFKPYEKLLDSWDRPILDIGCRKNKFCNYCDDQSVAVEFQ